MSDQTPTPDYEAAAKEIAERGGWAQWWTDTNIEILARGIVDAALEGLVVVSAGEYYEVKDISTRDAFVDGGLLAIDAQTGKHAGVLVRVGGTDDPREDGEGWATNTDGIGIGRGYAKDNK